jgi:toxin ParE1/3/4
MYQLIFAQQFKSDLQSCVDYVRKKLQNPIAAKDLRNKVKETYKLLRENPYMRPLVKDEELAEKGYRFISVKNYLIFYVIDEPAQKVDLVAFMYARRNWQQILGTEK